jgi:hypothetical protein
MSDAKDRVFRTEPRRLACLLDLTEIVTQPWRTQELSAILKHQLSAPIESDLAQEEASNGGIAQRVNVLTFGDLFHHPAPPIELLRSVKDFAKSNRNHPASAIPNEIATLLYFASIAVAWKRCGQRITSLSEREIREGIAWTLAQDWVDSRTKSLLREAVQRGGASGLRVGT